MILMRAWTIRAIDILAGTTWVAAVLLLTYATIQDSSIMGRWALLLGIAAHAFTAWALASWIIQELRAEVSMGRLRIVRHLDDDSSYG